MLEENNQKSGGIPGFNYPFTGNLTVTKTGTIAYKVTCAAKTLIKPKSYNFSG